MARYCERDVEPVLEAASIWRDRCLIDDLAIFTDENIWDIKNLGDLHFYFTENPDVSNRTFYEKLEDQLKEASPETKKLAAEMIWFMFLFVSNEAIGAQTKRDQISMVYGWSGYTLDLDHPMLHAPLERGVGNPGTAYNTRRWAEFQYLIDIVTYLKSNGQVEELMEDPWRFSEWLDNVTKKGRPQLRHIIKYLLFPDYFERIATANHKRKIVNAFHDKNIKRGKFNLTELDKELLEIRREQEKEFNTEELDFYLPPLVALWDITSKLDDNKYKSIAVVLEKFIEQSKTDDLKTSAYPAKYDGLDVRVSFGVGNQAYVTWMAFLGPGQTPTKGIYPVYLYYKNDNLLVLSRGISATNPPELEWVGDELVTIKDYYSDHLGKKPIRYGDSYIYKVYDLSKGLDEENINRDLDLLIEEYDELVGSNEVNELDSSYKTSEEVSKGVEQKLTMMEAMEGVFMSKDKIENILELLEKKKNIVLQGPPGVGKTFVAKRLAYALMGAKAPSQVEMIQFHQAYAYEDFIQGYRPSDAGFELKNGIFHLFCTKAASEPEQKYVFIIDEINRGNLSKIFGELMMLLESDKRGKDWAMPLSYSKDLGEKFYVPENVYVIGLMNTADRSLALVDYALRRRFAFVTLEPEFESEAFIRYMEDAGAGEIIITKVVSRITALNERIASDIDNLGPGFTIGHSFFCVPPKNGVFDDLWYEQIIQYEIEPLLNEYWFDEPDTVKSVVEELLA